GRPRHLRLPADLCRAGRLPAAPRQGAALRPLRSPGRVRERQLCEHGFLSLRRSGVFSFGVRRLVAAFARKDKSGDKSPHSKEKRPPATIAPTSPPHSTPARIPAPRTAAALPPGAARPG